MCQVDLSVLFILNEPGLSCSPEALLYPLFVHTQHYPNCIAAQSKEIEALFSFVFVIAQKAGLPNHPQHGSSNPRKISHIQRRRAWLHSSFLAPGCRGRCPEAGTWADTGPRDPGQESTSLQAGGVPRAGSAPLGLTVNRDAEAHCPPPAIQTDIAHSLDRERMPEEIHIHGNVIP